MKVLVPVDDSEPARHAIEWVARAMGGVGTEVVLLNVRNGPEYHGELPPLDYETIDRGQREHQQKLLAKALEHALRIGLPRTMVDASIGLPGDEIVRIAREKGVDQIVMGTHGRGAMGALFIGSAAHRVLHLAPMPVTLVK
jgi:nucleotide-binding universal stress UspA family protein